MSNLNATFGEGFFKQLIGTSITSNPRVAVIELIANAWDAGATKIEILWPKSETDGIFEIRDNGHGMTEELFQKRYMEISYDRTKEQGSSVSFNSVKRKTYGKNGIGRFAGFCFSDPYLVATSSDGKESWTFSVRQSQGDKPLDVKKIENKREFTAPGTCIFSSEPIVRTLEENDLKKEIGLRFLSDPSFEIYVNGERVNLLDVPSQNVRKFEAKINGYDPIEIIAIFTDQSDSTTDQHGVAWHVNSRLVGECRWKGPNGETFLDGRKTIAKRFTFIVKADCLAPFVNSDWTGFKPDTDFYPTVINAVQSAILSFINEFFKDVQEKRFKEIKDNNEASLQKLSPLEIETWEGFVAQTQEKCINVTDEVVDHISTILANLMVSKSRYALLHKLSTYNPDQLDNLDSILERWTVDMAKLVLDELEIRMRLVKELELKVKNKKTDEVKELQPLFEKGLWIFGPEFESIHYSSNKGITHILNELFGIDEKGSLNRPDFVILEDASIGAYALPDFDPDDGGESGIRKVVIVELKKPGIAIGTEQKDQCWKYVKELYTKGAVTDSTDVVCFVLGSHLDPQDSDVREEKKGKVKIKPMTYNSVITRANSRLFHLKSKIENAPFLQEKGIKEFAEKSSSLRKQGVLEGV